MPEQSFLKGWYSTMVTLCFVTLPRNLNLTDRGIIVPIWNSLPAVQASIPTVHSQTSLRPLPYVQPLAVSRVDYDSVFFNLVEYWPCHPHPDYAMCWRHRHASFKMRVRTHQLPYGRRNAKEGVLRSLSAFEGSMHSHQQMDCPTCQ